MTYLQRRQFIAGCASGSLVAMLPCGLRANALAKSHFDTRGVVLVPEDLTLADWPQQAKSAGLTTIALHHQNSPQAVIRCVQSDAGQRFFEQCQKLGLQIEYELHAMKELLPRDLFVKSPDLFRMNDKGERTPEANCCVHCRQTLDLICENALGQSPKQRRSTACAFCQTAAPRWMK